MKKLFYLSLVALVSFASCSDDDDKKYYKPASLGTTMTLSGGVGGASAQNSVYVDFSAETQDTIVRSSWQLAFGTGTSFTVKVNSTIGGRAVLADEGVEINTVLDSAYYGSKLSMSMTATGKFDIVDHYYVNPSNEKVTIIDLNKTVINQKGKVYVFGSESTEIGLYKVMVTEKNANTYLVSFSSWKSSEVKTIEVSKNASYDYVGVSLVDNKVVQIQPEKENWDFVWGRNTYFNSSMMAGTPFVMADIVFINAEAGVLAAKVLTADVAYDDYKEENLDNTKFSNTIDAIGSDWRTLAPYTHPDTGETIAASAFSDRFYVIKDTDSNIYKIRFVSLISKEGLRGYPQVEYALVKKASAE